MADLEERFLQRNVPGRYSSWNDYEDDRRINGRDGYDGEDFDGAEHDGCDDGGADPRLSGGPAASPSSSRSSRALAAGGTRSSGGAGGRLPRGGNTGVRGVASDYRAAREEGAYRASLERREREEARDRAANGARLRAGEGSLSLAARDSARRPSRDDRDGESDSDSEEEEEDDEFLKEYRARRLRQLQSASALPTYGSLTEATKFEFADAVDSTDPLTTLAVHMYEPSVRACAHLNRILEDLARSMPHVRFLRLRASEAGLNLDPVGLPSLALYRGGELVHNLTPVTERLPPEFDMEDVRELLEECGAAGRSLPGEGNAAPRRENGNLGGREERGQGQGRMQARPVVTEEYDSDDADLDEFCRDFEPPS